MDLQFHNGLCQTIVIYKTKRFYKIWLTKNNTPNLYDSYFKYCTNRHRILRDLVIFRLPGNSLRRQCFKRKIEDTYLTQGHL